ncbi:MAG: AraC family transcriptional regulator [Deltaproteobacteria bacterium]|nr:AraC family transcriptional regulator [Deltaproteobacteria bacterium]
MDIISTITQNIVNHKSIAPFGPTGEAGILSLVSQKPIPLGFDFNQGSDAGQICQLENIWPGFDLILADLTASEDLNFAYKFNGPTLVFSTVLAGEAKLSSKNDRPNSEGLFNLKASSAESVEWLKDRILSLRLLKGQRLSSVSLGVSLEFLRGLASQFGLCGQCLKSRLSDGLPFLNGQKRLSSQKRQIAAQILNPPIGDNYSRLFRHGKATELLAIYMSQLTEKEPQSSGLCPSDLKKLGEARRVLETNFRSPPKLKTLSRLCGLNESKLKTGFRDYFGQTFSDIIRKERMSQALAMLTDEEKPVNLVANLVGYRNISYFIEAFRTEFGQTPGQLRRLRRSANDLEEGAVNRGQ